MYQWKYNKMKDLLYERGRDEVRCDRERAGETRKDQLRPPHGTQYHETQLEKGHPFI